MWHIKVPASTANLGSGFDALGMALSLPLECWFSLADSLEIEVRGEGEGLVPESSDNLVWKTADLMHREVTGHSMPPGRLTIKSRIPLARGLGSSAAAIVAGLMLSNTVLAQRLTREDLLRHATQLEGHPDNVAAALFGGLVMAWTEGAQIRVKRYPAPELRCLLLIPDYKVSTEKARQVLPDLVPLADAVYNAQRVALWIDALHRRDWTFLPEAGRDRLHQPYRAQLVAGLDHFIDAALAKGARLAALSGSGPTIVALVDSDHAVDVAEALKITAQETFSLPWALHDVTPSYFGAESVLDGWQWHNGDPMGFASRSDDQMGQTTTH